MMRRRLLLTTCVLIAVSAGSLAWLNTGRGARTAAVTSYGGAFQTVKLEHGTTGASTVKVASVGALRSALKSLRGGETVLLAPGTYSGAEFNGLSYQDAITITSADPNERAVLTNFNIANSHGLKFAKLELLAQSTANYAFIIRGSSNIAFDRVSVHGSMDGDVANDPSGLSFLNSSNISVTNSEFQQLGRGMGVGSSRQVVVAGNHVHDIRSDGFDFAEVSDIRVTNNVLKRFSPAPKDHPDAIQFWTAGTKTASRDILIAGNLIERADGAGSMQGIFMGDEVGSLPYERVTISDNLIVGTGYNAVRIHGAKDLKVINNELITNANDYKTFMLVQKADGVVAKGNKAVSIGFDGVTNLSQDGNEVTKPVKDRGARALKAWQAKHPLAARAGPAGGGSPEPHAIDSSPLSALPGMVREGALQTAGSGGSQSRKAGDTASA